MALVSITNNAGKITARNSNTNNTDGTNKCWLNSSEDFQKCRFNKLKKPWRQNAMASFFTTNYSNLFIANECCINSQDGTQIVYDFYKQPDFS